MWFCGVETRGDGARGWKCAVFQLRKRLFGSNGQYRVRLSLRGYRRTTISITVEEQAGYDGNSNRPFKLASVVASGVLDSGLITVGSVYHQVETPYALSFGG